MAAHDNDNDDDDDEEEEDEDYDPTQDQEAMEAEKEDEAEEGLTSSQPLPPVKTAYPAVDQAFQELFGYPWGTVYLEPKQPTSSSQQNPSKRKRITRLSAVKKSKNEILLTQLFGHEAAMKIIHAPVILPQSRLQPAPLPPLEVSLQQGKRALTVERKRFAGVDMWVQTQQQQQPSQQQQQQQTPHSDPVALHKTGVQNAPPNILPAAAPPMVVATPAALAVPSTATATATMTATSTTTTTTTTSGLDAVLQELVGPTKLSTVAKTSADWDVFKTQQGAAAEVLEERAQGKDAFLVKQDFLSRVDVRRFEQEKAQRDLQRSSKK